MEAARAGYHDGFAFGVGIHEAVVGCDGIAPEQVGHRDFFERADADFPVHQVFHSGNGQHFARIGFQFADDSAALFLSRAGNGEQDFSTP